MGNEDLSLGEVIRVLADRPQCEHGLNGPCRECGPGLSLGEAVAWERELGDLGVR